MHQQEAGLGVLVLTTNPILADLAEILASSGFIVVGVRSMDEFVNLSEPPQCCLVVMDDSVDRSVQSQALAHVRNAPVYGLLRLVPAVGSAPSPVIYARTTPRQTMLVM